MLNIVFFGTDIFAKTILENLIQHFKVIAVVTKQDEIVGRKKVLEESKISKLAKENNIEYLKPNKLKDIADDLKKMDPDLFIVAEYGKIIPESILNIPKYGAINIHGSILPKYRGASPIQYSLLNENIKTGITIIQMDKEMDHGNIIKTAEIKIDIDDDQITLREKLAKLGADTLINLLSSNLPFKSIEQNHDEATCTKLIEKNDGLINLENDLANNIIAKFKAYKPWPGIFIIENNKRIKINDISYKIYNLESVDKTFNNFIVRDNKELFIKDKNNKLVKVNKVQLEGKNEIDAKDFINQIKQK